MVIEIMHKGKIIKYINVYNIHEDTNYIYLHQKNKVDRIKLYKGNAKIIKVRGDF